MKKHAASAAALLAVLAVGVASCRGTDEPNEVPHGVTTTTVTTTHEAQPGGDNGNGTVVTTAESQESRPHYLLSPTRRCLEAAGAAVSTIRSTDPRLRALGDLAQRTSLQVRVDRRTVGLAFGDTGLLASLLRVPDDPYRLEVRRNVLLMYKPSAREEAAIVVDCLRS